MFHVQQHSPIKQTHGRSAALLRSASPHKKHAHRLGDGDIAGDAGPSNSHVPIKPTQRPSNKPTLGKSLDAGAAKALFGSGTGAGAGASSKNKAFSGPGAGTSKLMKPSMITTPPAGGVRSQDLMTSPRRALGDKTNASPQRPFAELQPAPVTWNQSELGALSLEGSTSVEPPVLKGILASTALTEDELDELFGEFNGGDYARNAPLDRPDTFADLPPSTQSFSIATRNIQAILCNHFMDSGDGTTPYEPPTLASIMGPASQPAPTAAPQPSTRRPPVSSSSSQQSRPPAPRSTINRTRAGVTPAPTSQKASAKVSASTRPQSSTITTSSGIRRPPPGSTSAFRP
ncbi:hypothetical protein V8E36_006734 [Tilletia maclaganii]